MSKQPTPMLPPSREKFIRDGEAAAATMTPKEVAERWGGCDIHTILRLIKTGQLEAFDISQNAGSGRPRWRVHCDAVLAFERRRSATAQSEQKRQLRTQRRQRRHERAARKAAHRVCDS